MYTELIFGASLKEDTPQEVIQTIQDMIDGQPTKKSFQHLFNTSSYYFGINEPLVKFWKDDIRNCWILSSRSNVKNYDGEIEAFLEWIKPYIEKGSGEREFYAIATYEESREPVIYYLEE